jgi:hypothetical protein
MPKIKQASDRWWFLKNLLLYVYFSHSKVVLPNQNVVVVFFSMLKYSNNDVFSCSNMTEFTEAEITRAIGILRTNGMKLEQVKDDLYINTKNWHDCM